MTSRRLAPAAVALLLALLGAGEASAATKVVSFDDLTAGTDVSTQYQSSHGVFFQGPPDDGAFPRVMALPAQAHSGTRVAEVPQLGEGYLSRTVGRLNPTARTVSAYVGLTAGPRDPETVTLTAFDAGGNPLGSSTVSASPGGPLNQQVSVTSLSLTADIASFELRGQEGGGSVGMDDLSITTPDLGSPPDFGLTAGGNPANVPQGDSVDVPVSLNRLNGSNGDVSLSVSGLPPGMTASFSPNPVTGTGGATMLRLTASETAPPSPSAYAQITITGTPGPGAGSAPRTARKLVRVVENCTRAYRADYIDARTEGCMRTVGPFLESRGQTVRLNGLVLTPVGPAKLDINRSARTITSVGTFRVAVAGHPEVPVYVGTINWNAGGGGDGPKQVSESAVAGVEFLEGIRLTRAAVSLTKAGGAEVVHTLTLDYWPFDYLGEIGANTAFTTDNDRGADFSSLEIKVEKVEAVGIELKDVEVKWRQGESWSGAAKLGIRFISPYSIGAGIGLKKGELDFLKGSVGGLNVAVSPGVFLQGIGVEVQRSPRALAGTAEFSAGPEVAGKSAVEVEGGFKAVLSEPFVFELTGKAEFGGKYKLADVFARYTSVGPGLIEIGGKLDWDLSVAYVKGEVAGFVRGLEAASREGRLRGCIRVRYLPDPCAGAGFIVSNIGIAACVDLVIVSGGVGYYWGGDFDLFGGSCNLSPWRPAAGASAVAAGAPRRVRLKPGLPSAAFAVEGIGDAPGVTLTGPRGETISVSRENPFARSGNLLALLAENGTTYAVVKRPAGGVWTLTDDATVPIRRVRQAVGLPRPSVRAGVTGTGRRRTLRWRLKRIPGQRVRFFEAGRGVRNLIATGRAGRGERRFRPGDGPGGRRRIIALVEQEGLPRASLVAGSFRAPPPLRPGRPRRLRVVRRGGSLVVRWRSAPRGFRHAVHVKLRDGRRLLRIVPAGRQSVTLRRVDPRYAATVTARGLTHANGRGPAARVTIPGRMPRRPAAGTWKMTSAFVTTRNGSFAVRRGGTAVTRLRVTPRSRGAAKACRTATLDVAGPTRLTRGTRAGAAAWTVRKQVTVRRGRKRLRGRLTLSFVGRRKAEGELRLRGCRLPFSAKR